LKELFTSEVAGRQLKQASNLLILSDKAQGFGVQSAIKPAKIINNLRFFQ